MLVILASLSALGPVSIDAYIPGLPRLAESLHSPAWAVQLTVTACLAGLAVGQLVAGPLSDALEAGGGLLYGLSLYTGAGLLCGLAPTIWLLVVLRAAQGLGGAFALVIAYAYVSDLHEGKAAARYFSLLTLVTGLAPVLAPLVGAQLLQAWGWRAVFVATSVLSALVLAAGAGSLPESHPPHLRQERSWRRAGPVYGRLLRDRSLLGPVLANALSFAVMFAYIAGSPFVLQSLYGLGAGQYSLVFAVNACGLVAAAGVSGVLVGRLGARSLLRAGVTGSAAASVVLLVLALMRRGAVAGPRGAVRGDRPRRTGAAERARAGAAAARLPRRAAAALLGCGQFLFGGSPHRSWGSRTRTTPYPWPRSWPRSPWRPWSCSSP